MNLIVMSNLVAKKSIFLINNKLKEDRKVCKGVRYDGSDGVYVQLQ